MTSLMFTDCHQKVMGTGIEGNELDERKEIGKNLFMSRVVDEWSKLRRCVVEANTLLKS